MQDKRCWRCDYMSRVCDIRSSYHVFLLTCRAPCNPWLGMTKGSVTLLEVPMASRYVSNTLHAVLASLDSQLDSHLPTRHTVYLSCATPHLSPVNPRTSCAPHLNSHLSTLPCHCTSPVNSHLSTCRVAWIRAGYQHFETTDGSGSTRLVEKLQVGTT